MVEHLLKETRRYLEVALALLRGAVASLRANAGLALLSVALAFLLWVFVDESGEARTTRSGLIPNVEVQVQPVNLPQGLALANELPLVRVRGEASIDAWNRFTAEDFRAFVVLTGLSEGRHTVPVRVEARTARGGLRVIEPVPDQIEVTLVPLFVKSVPVEVTVEGSPAQGFTVSGMEFTPQQVTVAGAQDLVTLVSRAVARLDISGAREDTTRFLPLEPQDRLGVLVRGVSLDPGTVSVTVSIGRRDVGRLFPVAARVTGTPAPGYNVVSVGVEPALVELMGTDQELEGVSLLSTAPVDITGAQADVVRTVPLELPPGVSARGTGQVTVRVSIQPAQGEATFGVAPQVSGLGPGLRVVSITPQVQVLLAGPLPTLSSLDPSSIVARVDLTGLGAGSHRVGVRVEAPQGLRVVSVTPQTVEVTLAQGP
jgi:YbbR domain-containing protein